MQKTTLPIINIKKYGGKQVAVADGKIIASGMNTKEVLDKARHILPHATWRDIVLITVPKGLTVVY